jgi:hypothetical protein
MNQNLECSLRRQNGPPTDQEKLASERAVTLREEEWQLHNECIILAREALEHYKAQGEKRLRIPDLVRIIDLASRLGRLATGIPTEHIEHAWSEYQNQLWTAQFEADIRRIYGNSEDHSRSADFQSAVSQASSLQHQNAAGCQTLPEPRSSGPAETKSLGRSNNSKNGSSDSPTCSLRIP